jgi:glutaredoxin 3
MTKVKLYSTPTCPFCIQLRAYLDENSIDYEYVDVASDREAAQEMVDKSGQMGVPVIEIDGEITVGFKKDIIAEKLGVGRDGT